MALSDSQTPLLVKSQSARGQGLLLDRALEGRERAFLLKKTSGQLALLEFLLRTFSIGSKSRIQANPALSEGSAFFS